MAASVTCAGCGALVPDIEGPTHPYMDSAPGCWALYCTLQQWNRTTPDDASITAVQDLVDSYAAQHPTNTDRRNRQSVAVHLISLCASIEHGVSGVRRRSLLGTWTHREYPALMPPPTTYSITAVDIGQLSAARFQQMAEATWSAWVSHHDTVRGWLSGVKTIL